MTSTSRSGASSGRTKPGPGCIYVKQELKFKAPVKIGDTLIAHVTIKKLIPEKNIVECEVMVPARG